MFPSWLYEQIVEKSWLCSRHGRGIYESTTTGGGGVLGAAPQPSHLPTFPVGGPPESVTLSIILDDNDDAGWCCLTSGHVLPFRSMRRRRRRKKRE